MAPIPTTTTLIAALEATIESKIAQGKKQTARKQAFCIKKVEKFLSGNDIALNAIDSCWLREFCLWMKSNEKLSENTAQAENTVHLLKQRESRVKISGV